MLRSLAQVTFNRRRLVRKRPGARQPVPLQRLHPHPEEQRPDRLDRQVSAWGDNAAMRSFSALLRKNVLDPRRCETRAQPRLAKITWTEAHSGSADLPARLSAVSACRCGAGRQVA